MIWNGDEYLGTGDKFLTRHDPFRIAGRLNDVSTVLVARYAVSSSGGAVYDHPRFSFSYPDQFSYNAIANMYFFGLFVTLMFSCFKRSNGVLLAIAASSCCTSWRRRRSRPIWALP